MNQKVLSGCAYLQGIGLHSGKNTSIAISALPADSGIIFKRTDVKHNNIIEAKYYNVDNTSFCTELRNEHGVRVHTVEHLMAAIWGLGIDNALIEVRGEEVPAMDGSSQCFMHALQKVGVKTLPQKRKSIKILDKVSVNDGDKNIMIEEANEFSVEFSIDFDHKSIGKQRMRYNEKESFAENISMARTFGFANELEYLKSNGLGKGVSLDNAIGLDENGIMNPEGLRGEDEFVKHKILDCIGDLFLAGNRVIGKVRANKAGHHLNNKLLRKIFSQPSSYKIV